MLRDAVYLDHAGTTLYAKSLLERFSTDLITNLYGNPHSASPSSQLSTSRVDDCRHAALRLFNADPAHYDLVFVANATAGIKLVIEALRVQQRGFWYGYHRDSHTSLVGAREEATAGHHCFTSDEEVESWLNDRRGCNSPAQATHDDMVDHSTACAREDGASSQSSCSSAAQRSDVDETSSSMSSENHSGLMEQGYGPRNIFNSQINVLAYPAQSNMNGRRLPLSWTRKTHDMRMNDGRSCYTLLDAAALVSTSPLDLSDPGIAPDFTVLSFYKMFGFPDLGAVVVRKDASGLLNRRKYFGGGTVDMVTCDKEQWHAPKTSALHDMLEDGTLPVRNIIALQLAIDVHKELYGSVDDVSKHTLWLHNMFYERLTAIHHHNGVPLCNIYMGTDGCEREADTYGPIIAFNMRSASGAWVSNAEVEKLSSIRNIHLRTGGLCNPSGMATALNLAPWELKQNFSAGVRCDGQSDVVNGKPTGLIRVSFGAMSTKRDVETFAKFLKEFFVEKEDVLRKVSNSYQAERDTQELYIEKLTVYPIKSCAGWDIPADLQWHIRSQGLAWDREWCIVHAGTRKVMSMKRYPKMALIRPHMDFQSGKLRIRFDAASLGETRTPKEVEVPLSGNPSVYADGDDDCLHATSLQGTPSEVCGDFIDIQIYTSRYISSFLSLALGVPCQLGRFPSRGGSNSARHMKPHLQSYKEKEQRATESEDNVETQTPLQFSNESPILAITRESLNRMNEDIAARSQMGETLPVTVPAGVFRANIILSQSSSSKAVHGELDPYAEDTWSEVCIQSEGSEHKKQHSLNVLGPCRRCQIVCVDPRNGEKIDGGQPFATLAKTRRKGGMCWFGIHCALGGHYQGKQAQEMGISVGQDVLARRIG
ncbi:MAG: hypothetical protein M1831_003846 [Alyxoria varia]|nr:MAG: hypothetical protein M1831_003846 [Alyxoria varia]